MQEPQVVAAVDFPGCMIAVADRIDNAIHVFSTRGQYLRSINGGVRDTSALAAVYSMAINVAGEIVVSDRRRNTVAKYTADGSLQCADRRIIRWPEHQAFHWQS
jgi:hypothetical protein